MAAGEIPVPGTLPTVIGVRGARHNNLRDVDVDAPLWRTVVVVGVSGSGKTSLAIGTLYAEGMQRFLDNLSTYSRRRLTQPQRPDVDRIEHLPPALALRQRPPVPGPRSTVGTTSEVLNVLHLMMSRLGSHLCPNGHRVGPSVANPRHGGRLPGVQRAFRTSQRRIFRLQPLRRVPGLGARGANDPRITMIRRCPLTWLGARLDPSRRLARPNFARPTEDNQ
jgi:excinuclease ABC subunit A